MLRSQTLSNRVGAPVYLKCENLQKTGAFKVRGALHRLLQLSDEQRARYAERNRQARLARERGEEHIGRRDEAERDG